MSDWQPIETAPKDGTRIWLTNGKVAAFGYWYVRIEEPTHYLGYDEGCTYPDGSPRMGDHFTDIVPNPKAGEVNIAMWMMEPPNAFREEDKMMCDWDGNYGLWEPTHWMPLPRPPGA